MNTINIEDIQKAVMHLAEKTGKKQHIEILFSASFYSHRDGVSLKWKGYLAKAAELEFQAIGLRALAGGAK